MESEIKAIIEIRKIEDTEYHIHFEGFTPKGILVSKKIIAVSYKDALNEVVIQTAKLKEGAV